MNAELCFRDDIEARAVRVPEAALRRLALRLGRARAFGEAWDASLQYGVSLALVERLLDLWCDSLDSGAFERRLEALQLFRSRSRDSELTFAHARSEVSSALPLLWLHGYSGSAAEAQPAVGLLTAPAARGGRDDDAFHVVAPGLPGFGLSSAEHEPTLRGVAESCACLMAELGYRRYAVHGSGLGASIAAELTRMDASRVAGLHVTWLPSLGAATSDLGELSVEEKSQLAALHQLELEWAYAAPQSPLERLSFAARELGDFEDAAELDPAAEALLWGLSLGLLLGDRRQQRRLASQARAAAASRSETAVCLCSFPLAPPTLRRAVESRHLVTHWHEQPRGGELAAFEQPEVLVDSLRRFFAEHR